MRVESGSDYEISMCERELLDAAWIPVSRLGSDDYPVYGVVKAFKASVMDRKTDGTLLRLNRNSSKMRK